MLAAERAGERIAVEVKGFTGSSPMQDLEQALGQFTLYGELLAQLHPDHDLYLAVPEEIFAELFEEPIGQLLIDAGRVRLLTFDPETEAIVRWVPERTTRG